MDDEEEFADMRYCYFCEDDTKKRFNQALVCINGHYILQGKDENGKEILKELLPPSVGDHALGMNIIRQFSLDGEIVSRRTPKR